MKRIIEISEEDYKWLDYQSVNLPILKVIKDGIPLDDIKEYMRAMECLYYLKGVVEASHPELLIQPEISCIARLLQRRWEDVPCRVSDK